MPPELRLGEKLAATQEKLQSAEASNGSPLFKMVYKHSVDHFREDDCPLAYISAESGLSAQVTVVVWNRDAEQDEEQLVSLHDELSRYFDLRRSKFERLFLQGWRYRSFRFPID